MASMYIEGSGWSARAAHAVPTSSRTSCAVSWPRERHHLVADARVPRAGQRHPVHARTRDRHVRRARPALRRGRLVVLGRGGPGPRDRVLRAVRAGPRHLPGRGMGDVVHRRADQPRASVRGPMVRSDPGRARRGVGGRGRRHADVDLRRPASRDRSPRPGAPRSRGRVEGRRRDLPADDPGDRRRRDGLLQDRGDLGADLQRVRAGRRRGPAGGCRRVGALDRRRVPPEGPRRPDARGGARGPRPRAIGQGDDRPAARGRGPRGGGTRLVDRDRGGPRTNRSPPRRWRASTRCSSATRAAPRGDRKACCTSTAASS